MEEKVGVTNRDTRGTSSVIMTLTRVSGERVDKDERGAEALVRIRTKTKSKDIGLVAAWSALLPLTTPSTGRRERRVPDGVSSPGDTLGRNRRRSYLDRERTPTHYQGDEWAFSVQKCLSLR